MATITQINARAVRNRLWTAGWHASSELDVVGPQELKRRRLAKAREDESRRKAEALAEQVRQMVEQQHKARDYLYVSTDNVCELAVKTPTVNAILSTVSDFYKTPIVDIVSQRRQASVCRVRQVVCYLARQLTTRSLPQIGKVVGDRDHTTVLHAVNKIAELAEREPGLAAELATLRERLGA